MNDITFSNVRATAVPANAHIPALDGLRGLAILAVMQFHFLQDSNYETVTSGLPRVIFRLLHAGWCGVDLFFVLSGFLITGILYDAKGSAHYFRNFYMRRTLRIFPLYYVVLGALFIMLPTVTHVPIVGPLLEHLLAGFLVLVRAVADKQTWLWLYACNLRVFSHDYSPFGFGLVGHFWSLAVEEHFYLFWPFLVLTFSRSVMLRICGGFVAFALACRIVFF